MFSALENKIMEVLPMLNGKKIIIWGYGKSGRFLEWFLKEKCRLTVDYIIDDSVSIYGKPIDRSFLLDYLDVNDIMILLALIDVENVKQILAKYGYIEDVDFVDMIDRVYEGKQRLDLSHWQYLEYRYGVDLQKPEEECRGDSNNYMLISLSTIRHVVEQCGMTKEDALFDFGAGKGGTLIGFYNLGILNLGGCELSRNIYNIWIDNFSKLGISQKNCYNMDATMCTDIDGYNYFYLFNSFKGETFQKVISNIETSYCRSPRKIRIIYVNTFCHKMVIANGIFRLEKQISSGQYIRLVNIYTT